MELVVSREQMERNLSQAIKNATIYVVEDESDIAELIRFNLNLAGYQVECFPFGEACLRAVEEKRPDLIVLDRMLPGIDGLEICQRLRGKKETADIPVVMVTAKGEETDILDGLEAGADDYLTKPFSPKVLTAKISAVLRRVNAEPVSADEEINIHGISIHPGRHEVRVNDEVVQLRNSEFRILHILARRPGWVFTRAQIVDALHGDNYAVTDRSVDFQMVGLRKKLGSAGELVETIRGVGYRFKEK